MHRSYLMATSPISFLFSLLLLLLPHTTRSTSPVCETRYCGIPIEFPFRLRGDNNQSDRCGYPGFEVFCNAREQALLTLPNAGEFVVKDISLECQRLWINDPDECLPARFLRNIDLTGSPFDWDPLQDVVSFIFLNCSNDEELTFPRLLHIPCLSNGSDHYSIVTAFEFDPPPLQWNSSCRKIGSALVPVKDSQAGLMWEELYSDIELPWNAPNCRNCEADQYCGFLADTGPDVTCYNNFPTQGGSASIWRSVVNYMPIYLGVTGCLCIICIGFLLTRRVSTNDSQLQSGPQSQTSIEIESNSRRPHVVGVGLDESAIEQCYPKIELGESGELPKSIDNVCSICLCEYEPMQTLRAVPQCNHYFHADCIDSWLKMNSTCPLCRNLPSGSALVISLRRPTTAYHSSS